MWSRPQASRAPVLIGRLWALIAASTVLVIIMLIGAQIGACDSAVEGLSERVQTSSSGPCGKVSLSALVFLLQGKEPSPESLSALACTEVSLEDIRKAAAQQDLILLPVAMSWESLADIQGPVIAHFRIDGRSHFSVIEVGWGWVRLSDGKKVGIRAWSDVEPYYTGVALVEKKAIEARTYRGLIETDDTSYDLGLLDLTATASHSFVLRNSGKDAVHVLGIILLGPRDFRLIGKQIEVIPSGGFAEVRVEWQPALSKKTDSQERDIVIQTDHPERAVYICSLRAHITQ